jgi:hypothetical protein
MDHNWPYVAAGYSVVTAALVTYATWLWNRVRRSEQSLEHDDSR